MDSFEQAKNILADCQRQAGVEEALDMARKAELRSVYIVGFDKSGKYRWLRNSHPDDTMLKWIGLFDHCSYLLHDDLKKMNGE